jgi:hypothetical protein
VKSHPRRAELRVSQTEDDGWTWCYVEPEHHVELYSNETYASADVARAWARRAYPDVPFAKDQEGDEEAEGEEE